MTSEFAIGVHALVFLNHKRKVESSEIVAENVCTNPARVRKVLSKLKKAGLVETKEGAEGGCLFDADANLVNLCMIADALGTTFVSASWKSGNPDMDCMIASGMAGLLDELYQGMDQNCREYLKKITIADLDRQIFTDRQALPCDSPSAPASAAWRQSAPPATPAAQREKTAAHSE